MTKGASVFDRLDIAEDGIRSGEPDASKLYEVKMKIAGIDDEVGEIETELDEFRDRFIDDEVTLKEVSEFLDSGLNTLLEKVAKIRERLY